VSVLVVLLKKVKMELTFIKKKRRRVDTSPRNYLLNLQKNWQELKKGFLVLRAKISQKIKVDLAGS
jgi:hypothetical protein